MNSVQLTGIVSQELKEFSDSRVVKFSMSDRNNGQRQFIDCIAYNNTAEMVVKLFKKGTLATVVGVLSLKPFTNKEGKEVKQIQIIVNNFEVLKDGREYVKELTAPKTSPSEPKKEDTKSNEPVIDDDALPF